MRAATDTDNGEGGAGPDIQALAQALRKLASNAADQTAGGLSLVFAAAPGDESADSAARLRAAAGFASPHAAREAAHQLHADVRDAIVGQATAVDRPKVSGVQTEYNSRREVAALKYR